MNDAVQNTTSIYDYHPRTEGFVENWFVQKQKDKMPVLVYELENQVIGYGSYGIFRAWDAYRFSVEHSVYVHKDHRGKGIGRRLLEALILQAKTDGYHTMIAGIDSDNTASMCLHATLGFKEAGRFSEVGFKFDRWLNLVFMQLML